MSKDPVIIEIADSIAHVKLNRPEKMNALDASMFEALSSAAARLNTMDLVRIVVLSGEGRSFCVGIDLSLLAGNTALGNLAFRTHGIANLFQNASWCWRRMPMPVIAAVHGFALGGGLQIALGADVRVMTPDAKLSIMETRWGLVPDMGAISLLRGLVRDDVARELTYTARQFSGLEAKRLGLATKIDAEPLQAAMTLAREIASVSPRAVRSAKRLFGQSQDVGAAEILLAEAVAQQELLEGPDVKECLSAHFEKRTTKFAE